MWVSSGKAASFLITAMATGAIVVGVCATSPSLVEEDLLTNNANFVVRLIFMSSHETKDCSGAVIGLQHVITAAGCLVDGLNWIYVFGGVSHSSHKKFHTTNGCYFIRHDNYSHFSLGNNLVIVKIFQTFDLDDRYSVVPLPTSKPDVSGEGALYGWSTCDNSRVITVDNSNVSFLENEYCDWNGDYNKSPELLCIGRGKLKLCPGDIGGPILSNGRLVGIITSGIGIDRSPFFVQNVYHYLDWIKRVINPSYAD